MVTEAAGQVEAVQDGEGGHAGAADRDQEFQAGPDDQVIGAFVRHKEPWPFGDGHQTGEACGCPAAQLPCHLGYLPGKPHRAALMALEQSGNLLAEVCRRQPRTGQTSRRTRRWTTTWRPSTGTSLTVRR